MLVSSRVSRWSYGASLGLARLLMDDADNEGACHLIEPLHRSFSEGFDTPDVKQAGALLGELTS